MATSRAARSARALLALSSRSINPSNSIPAPRHSRSIQTTSTGTAFAQPDGYGVLPSSLSISTNDNITWSVGFAGNTETGIVDGLSSLKDGDYDLIIDAARVHPLGFPGIDMAANSTTTFHRLYGDTDAPGTPSGGIQGVDFAAVVNTGDNLAFRNAFNKPAGGGYQTYLDFNGDGVINSGDNLQFRNRFNKSLTWRA
jgi:hypothetical protein